MHDPTQSMARDTVTCDSKGRVVLPKEVRKRFGQAYYVVPTIGDVVLIPVPKDPVKDFWEMGKKAGLDKLSIKEMKKSIREQLEKEL